jgi:hypothetical protein
MTGTACVIFVGCPCWCSNDLISKLRLLLRLLLCCQVLGTATLRGEGASTLAPKSAVTTANISILAPVLVKNNTPSFLSSSEDAVTVTLDDVSTKLITNSVWSLKVLPVDMPENKATMAASAGLNLTFNVHYLQTVEKVRQALA